MFVLHSHLPYVLCHGRTPHGTDWLTEAAAECYIPLLDALYDLVDEGVSPHITVGITPVLTEMLADHTFEYEFTQYLQDKILAAERDEEAFKSSNQLHFAYLAQFWQKRYKDVFRSFRIRYKKSIIGAFKQLQDDGHIEIITSGATHGYSPLLSQDTSVQAQVKQGVQTYKKHYGRAPRGFWMPECAYRPRYSWAYPVAAEVESHKPYLRKGVEEFLGENGLRYFMVESHLLKGWNTALSNQGNVSYNSDDNIPAGVYADRFPAIKKIWNRFSDQIDVQNFEQSVYLAHYIDGKGEEAKPVAVFARDPKTGQQVWSAKGGYPGDPNYLEFHRKRTPGGHKYYRITGHDVDLGAKLEYHPEAAQERVAAHAAHFVEIAKQVLKDEYDRIGRKPVICAPYDAELYGHWWFEGVDWLKSVIRIAASDPEISLLTGSEALESHAADEPIQLPEGSWGEGGFHYTWLNNDTQWAWKLIYNAEDKIKSIASIKNGSSLFKRFANQAARELLLLEASDWEFNITTSTSTDYAELRIKWHYNSFAKLTSFAEKLNNGKELTVDELDFLAYCEERDSLFENIDISWFAEVEHKPRS